MITTKTKMLMKLQLTSTAHSGTNSVALQSKLLLLPVESMFDSKEKRERNSVRYKRISEI